MYIYLHICADAFTCICVAVYALKCYVLWRAFQVGPTRFCNLNILNIATLLLGFVPFGSILKPQPRHSNVLLPQLQWFYFDEIIYKYTEVYIISYLHTGAYINTYRHLSLSCIFSFFFLWQSKRVSNLLW